MTATIFLSLYFLPNWVDSILIGLKRKHPSPTSFPLKIHPTKHPKNNLLSPFLSSLSILPRIHSNQMDTYVFFCAYISFGSLFMPKKKRKKNCEHMIFFFFLVSTLLKKFKWKFQFSQRRKIVIFHLLLITNFWCNDKETYKISRHPNLYLLEYLGGSLTYRAHQAWAWAWAEDRIKEEPREFRNKCK